MDTTRLEFLYERCIKGTATEQERQEYIDLMQLPENEATARKLLQNAFLENKEMQDVSRYTADSILQAILSAKEIHQQVPPTAAPVVELRSSRNKWLLIIAAAAVFGIILTSALIFINNNEKTVPETVAKSNVDQITPATNKALLTLADGSVVTLDDAQNGTLHHQGNIQVVKTDSGKLIYQGADKGIDSRLNNREAIAFNTLRTPRGGLFQITLSDGTRVWLNSASSLKYPVAFTGNERRVEFEGEGYFEVAKNSSQPFFVKLNNMEVQVLGTEFNIMAYEDEDAIRTSLLKGSVKVAANHHSMLIAPGQQASLPDGGRQFILSKPDMEEVLGWRNGQMSFSSAALPALMRQISRWYDVDIKYERGVPSGRFNGLIDRNLRLSDVLDVLEVYGIHTKLEGRTITVLP